MNARRNIFILQNLLSKQKKERERNDQEAEMHEIIEGTDLFES